MVALATEASWPQRVSWNGETRPSEMDTAFGIGPALNGWWFLIGGLVAIWAVALARNGSLGRWAIIASAAWAGVVVLLTALPLGGAKGIPRPWLAWEPRYVFEGDAWTVLMAGLGVIWVFATGLAWIRCGR